MIPSRVAQLAPFLLSWAIATSGLAQVETAPVEAPRLHGELRTVDGVDVLFLHGTEKDRGYAEGFLVGDRILELVTEFCLSKRVMPRPALWEMGVRLRIGAGMAISKEQRERAEATLQGMRARKLDLRLEAVGRDLDALDLIAASALPDFTGLACSSFSVFGRRVQGEGPIVGRNLDYFATDAVVKHIMVIVNAPTEGRHGWVNIGWPGNMGCLTGISDAGAFLSIHDVGVRGGDSSKKFTARPRALQYVIETLTPGSETARAAQATLRDHQFVMGGNFMLAWNGGATRGAAVFEVDGKPEDGGVTLRLPETGADFITCTNHHRARREPGRCNRYAKILTAEAETESHEALLTTNDVWNVIESASVSGTLYRLVADLGAGKLELDRRVQRGERTWHPRAHLDVQELLATVKEMANQAK